MNSTDRTLAAALRRTHPGARRTTLLLAGLVLLAPLASAQVCNPEWIPALGGEPGSPNPIFALQGFDDGSGPALFVGGEMGILAGTPVSRVARWDGNVVDPLGGGMNGTVRAFAVFNDGSGDALYAGGSFTVAGGVSAIGIARWDGTQWSPVGSGLSGGQVNALLVADLGSGPALYATGSFLSAGGVPANKIARWDGSQWQALGIGLGPGSASGHALEVFDDGSGPALYVGGNFTVSTFAPANWLARWNGSTWSSVGPSLNWIVYALEVFDDGSGPALYAGGVFTVAGGVILPNVGRWNGTQWSGVGGGTNQGVRSLLAFDDGTGPGLFAGGEFFQAGGAPAVRLAKWNGSAWGPVGGGISGSNVLSMAAADLGQGPNLYFCGSFNRAGQVASRQVASWNGSQFGTVGNGFGWAPSNSAEISALAEADLGLGKQVYLSGVFDTAAGAPSSGFGRFDGSTWTDLPGSQQIRALAPFDSGSGTALYGGGTFSSVGGVAANRLARFDGAVWSPLPAELIGSFPIVEALITYDDGTGTALYVGGENVTAAGVPNNGVARFDGQNWSTVGAGLAGRVRAFAVHDDGSGQALYAAGSNFTNLGAGTSNKVARWNGTQWQAVGNGIVSGEVESLLSADLGAGPRLFAGGTFNAFFGPGPIPPQRGLVAWDGVRWSEVGGGLGYSGSVVFGLSVRALAAVEDAEGRAILVGGRFNTAGGLPASGGLLVSNVARWDGSAWSGLGAGVTQPANLGGGVVSRFLVHDDGTGPSVYAAGGFWISPARDSHLARWRLCPPASDFASVAGCFQNPAQLSATSPSFSVGGTLDLKVVSPNFSAGLGVLLVGASGADGLGCGLLLPGLGEVLLALSPEPAVLAAVPAAAGVSTFQFPVPNQPQWVGWTFAFQGAHIATAAPGVPVELSNALEGTVSP